MYGFFLFLFADLNSQASFKGQEGQESLPYQH